MTQAQDTSKIEVSCAFIDNYMPAASGAYVKIYLYLLRCLMSCGTDAQGKCFSLSYLAGRLGDTEADINHAICYWEKQRLLTVTRDGSGHITSIIVEDPDRLARREQPVPASEPVNQLPSAPVKQAASETPAAREIAATFTAASMKALPDNEETRDLMDIVAMYLERPLTATDTQLLTFLLEDLNFSHDLIDYLYAYCVTKNKKNPSYIEKVALGWKEDKVDTIEAAKAEVALYDHGFQVVNKAFGLNRTPGQIERQYIKKWFREYGFSDSIVNEACSRTLMRIQKPDFSYADSILSGWHKNKVRTLKDVKVLDDSYMARKAERNVTSSPAKGTAHASKNKFLNFPQRNYSAEELAEMEKRLLQKD